MDHKPVHARDPGATVSLAPASDASTLSMRLRTQARHVRHVLSSNPISLIAFVQFLLVLFVGLFGPLIAPYDPLATDAAKALQPPSWDHWFGTDQLGRDVLSRVIVATRLDLMIS
ncbi:MAG: hypothetical protein AB7O70_15015, partial [Hyphomicrobiales bacterium]